MTKLVIVESPAKAKTISRFLGPEYQVEASYGHVRDLPQSADEVPADIKQHPWSNLGVNVDDQFQPVYVVPDSKKKQVAKLKKALKAADELLLATDEDREGESISWHLLQVLSPPAKTPVRRIVFHEITPEAIREALANPRSVDDALVQAQESRRILDRLYGYSLSPVLWKKVRPKLSAGRVQSIAVRLVVEREEERRAFVPSTYWDLEAEFEAELGPFKATLVRVEGQRLATGRDFDQATGQLKTRNAFHLLGDEAAELVTSCRENLPWRVAKLDEKPGKQRPAPPFTTSTLQQEANRKLGYGAERTMRIAQNLYEGVDLGNGERVGLITYMRTDSLTLSGRALQDAQDQIKSLYGSDYARGPRHYKTKTRNAQEAHEAIRPTQLARTPQELRNTLDRDAYRLYELIWKRTLASQMPDAEVLRTALEIEATGPGGRTLAFAANGKRILFPGYLKAYVEGSDDPAAELGDKETILPRLELDTPVGRPGDKARLVNLESKEHVTTPPARYTEASLVKALEEAGVGRPSTYASILGTIVQRGYVFLQSKALTPTFTAMAVTNLLRQHFSDYVSIDFTARMEDELDEIASGKSSALEHISAFYRGGASGGEGQHPGLEELIARETERIGLPDVRLGADPESGRPVSVRIGRYGPYVVVGDVADGKTANVPDNTPPADLDVDQALELVRKKAEGPRKLGDDPETGLPVYVADGRFGPYVQLGATDQVEGKPKRASLPKGTGEDDATLELALKLLSLPRELGPDPESGTMILANIGRYGPYVQKDRDFRSLKEGDNVHTVTLERALQLLAEPKGSRRSATKKVLKELGKTEAGDAIQVLDGRYGPYVTDGSVNATLPKGTAPESVSMEQAAELIAAKAAAKPKGRKAAKGAKKGRKAAKKARKASKKASGRGSGE